MDDGRILTHPSSHAITDMSIDGGGEKFPLNRRRHRIAKEAGCG